MAFDSDEELRNSGDRPTLPYDLREYAQLHTGPASWTADRLEAALEEALTPTPTPTPNPTLTLTPNPTLTPSPTPTEFLAELDEPLACETTLRPSDIPHVAITADEVRDHALDHREGYVLFFVDGVSNVAALSEITGLPKEETQRILAELCDRGVITTDSDALPPAPWHVHVQRYAI